MRAVVWLYAITLLAIGLYRQFLPIFQDFTGLILGDDGDGFFNLWVMSHNSQHFLSGSLKGILDGRIFFPNQQNSMLLSDTLFLPSILFTILEPLHLSGFARLNATSLILGIASFFFHWLFFHSLWRLAQDDLKFQVDKKASYSSYFLVPFFAYIANYSAGRSIFYVHFQNISSFWVIAIITGFCVYLQNRQSKWLYLSMLGFVAVNYSSQYFGVLSAIVVILFGLCLLAEGSKTIVKIIKQHWVALLCTGALVAPIILLYAKVHNVSTKDPTRNAQGIGWLDLIRPVRGTGAFDFLSPIFGTFSPTNHEMPAYLGYALILALVGILAGTYKIWREWIEALFRHRLTRWLALAFITISILRDYRHVVAWPALLLITLSIFGGWLMAWKWRLKNNISPVGFFLLGSALVIYSLSFGPSHFFRSVNPDASLWGVWAWLVPGVHKMRAIGRMAPIGQTLLLGFVAWFLFKKVLQEKSKVKFATLCLTSAVWMFVQACEHDSDLYITSPSSKYLTSTADENDFFNGLIDPILAFPVVPFHASTYPMLYFVNFPNVKLMNGYSGSSPSHYGLLMSSGTPDLPSESQIYLANQLGVATFVVFKSFFSTLQLEILKSKWHHNIFENERFYVFKSMGEGK